MFNIISKWRERRQQKKAIKAQQQTLQTWLLLERLFDVGQISFDRKSHRLFITQSLASLLMSNGADGWVRSVHNIYNYVHFLQTQQAWKEYMEREELTAVREAMRSGSLTRADIERIKYTRRKEIASSDMEPLKVEHFEFFIIPDSTEAKVEPLAVGYYEPESDQMEVATWGEVKQLLEIKSDVEK